jgi:hypothetical protein
LNLESRAESLLHDELPVSISSKTLKPAERGKKCGLQPLYPLKALFIGALVHDLDIYCLQAFDGHLIILSHIW